MEGPSLTLVILQGPRRGETFDFPPGSTVRIGRVVRGNTLAIKDAGISSKHLALKSNSGKWTVEDLDSSNGTALNSSRLPPLQPSDLRDGDEIKLGEVTSIMVRLRIENQKNPLPPPPQRGRRKQVAASVELAESEVRVSAEAEILPPSVPRRGRPRKARVPASQKAEPPSPVVGRVTRSKKNELVKCSNAPPARRGRKKEPAPPLPENDDDDVEPEIKDGPELGAKLAEQGQEGDVDRSSVVEIKGNEDLRPNLAEEGGGCEAAAEAEEMIRQSDSGKKQCETPAKDGPNSNEQRWQEGEEPDLEKMTLRDWFKYMEWRLTNHTVEASEKMIDEMRKKAARVQDYMDEQKARRKASGPLS